MEDIVGKVGVFVGEGAPDVVVPVPPLLDEPLELGHNEVIAALAGVVLPQAVVDFLPPVQAEDTLCISRLQNSVTSSSSSTPLVVRVTCSTPGSAFSRRRKSRHPRRTRARPGRP